MGLIISRNISANNETDTYPPIDPKYGFMATNKPSQAQQIEIEGEKLGWGYLCGRDESPGNSVHSKG